ncbi:MAG: hypothetical protein CL920_29010 [Deltaproteobacteria bacterium]|mgnify:CR=1 FL=1|nr:hypothetical protein [Deltaproteobacteria bacterium]
MTHKDDKREQHWQLSRREFCRRSAITIAVLAQGWLPGCSTEPKEQKKEPPPLPTCKESTTPEEKTIEAFCEVCMPGLQNDPKKIPGAVEACAVAMFFDPELPAHPYVPLIVSLLNSQSQNAHGDDFTALTYEKQIEVVDFLDQNIQLFGFAIMLVRLAYYSSEQAAYYLGYPGANGGYVSHDHFSFRKPMSEEMTKDGNLP